MTVKNLPQSILDKIKKEHIKPKPRWEFWLREYAMWALFILSIIVGSLATAVVIFLAGHGPWAQYLTDEGVIEVILLNIPYFWLVLLMIFILLAYFNFERTKKGYRYNNYYVVLGSVIISLVFGMVINVIGGGQKLEEVFYSNVSPYRQLMYLRSQVLSNPDEYGRLAGEISEVGTEELYMYDFHKRKWKVIIEEDTFLPTQSLQPYMRIMVLGEINSSTNAFHARIIQPFFDKMEKEPNKILKDQMK